MQWPPVQQWGPTQDWPRPRRRAGSGGVLFGTVLASMVAVAALVASIVVVVHTPRTEPAPGGADLSAGYDDRLWDRPAPAEVDVVDHPLYGAAVPEAVDCEVPALRVGSDESWEEFATASGTCLDAVWSPVMDELGLAPQNPEFAVTRESPDSDTADGYTLAYYESDRNLITVVLPNVRELSIHVPANEREDVWLALMGHEYGHHVQYATGILDVSHDLRLSAGSEDDELDTIRRTELQAECMAGIGLRGITGADEDALRTVNFHFNGGGDLDTHGSAANRTFWLEQGWSEDTVGSCNTYDAESGQVL